MVRQIKRKNDSRAYLFLAPALLLAALFWWFPAISGFVQSFLTVNRKGEILGFAGLSNFRILFEDPAFTSSLKVTLKFVLLFVPANTAVHCWLRP
ncbi:MAG: sugar ABC transporter permease [Spirochaetales bacterium]|nr:sugar ABC transporter permease [Spirochaetales bacterium]